MLVYGYQFTIQATPAGGLSAGRRFSDHLRRIQTPTQTRVEVGICVEHRDAR